MKLKNFPLLLLLSACGGVHSAQWEAVVPEPSYTVEMDASSIERLGDTARAWHRESYPAERMDNDGEFSYSQVKAQVQYGCVNRTMMLVRAVYINDQGVAVRDVNRAGLDSAAAVVPDTVEERLFERACKTKKAQVAKVDPTAKSHKKATAHGGKTAQAKVPARDAIPVKALSKGATDAADGTDNKEVAADHHGERAAADTNMAPIKLADLKGVNAKLSESNDKDAADTMEEEDPHAKHDAHQPTEPTHGESKEAKLAEKKPEHSHWTYEGKTGPEAWAKLDPEWSACAGKRQSPIDIRDSVRLDLDNIKFDYKPSPLKIVDNGHTVQVIYVPGSSITVNGEQFNMVQFHFHRPAEERVNGRTFDMVAHLVHKNKEGKLAVVAVLMQAAGENPFIRTLWTHLPLDTGVEVSVPTVSIDLNQFLPRSRGYFAFSGSLTTPPCTEGVLWIVLRSPIQVSRQQISVFAKLYKNNARPVQSANGRLIKESL
jgi:carbonic anhydrase